MLKTIRLLSLLLGILLIFSIGGVWATWRYAEFSPSATDTFMGIGLSVFDYPPEQILPGGDTETAPLGENHLKLVDLVLNEDNKGYGLNIQNNVLIHQLLRSQPVVFSNQKASGGNLKFILDVRNNTHGLYYAVEKVTDTLYYMYTFSVDELATAAGTSLEITAYRTSLEKSTKWTATKSYIGYAQTKSLRDMGESADSHSIAYSIDVTTWHL